MIVDGTKEEQIERIIRNGDRKRMNTIIMELHTIGY